MLSWRDQGRKHAGTGYSFVAGRVLGIVAGGLSNPRGTKTVVGAEAVKATNASG
jgi:hypothetical protein